MSDLYWLDFRRDRFGGPVVSGRLFREDGSAVLDPDVPGCLRAEAGVVFLVHGFNVSREEGYATLGGFRQALLHFGLQDHTIVGVLWPGDTAFFLSPAAYLRAPTHAKETARLLADFIVIKAKLEGPPCFIAHSLGCGVVLETLNTLWAGRRACSEVVLMAGAVNNDSLALPWRYQEAAAAAVRVTVLSSIEDQVLRLAFPMGDSLGVNGPVFFGQ